MNWIAQVTHVAAKDVRQARWALALYVALVAVAAVSILTAHALGPYWTSQSSEILGMRDTYVVYLPAVTVILGLLASAFLLQADSPTRANAFWASRPLAPSAVLAAKLLAIGIVVVAVPLAGGRMALGSFDSSALATSSLLIRAGVSYAEWALAVMIIGALTDDIRAFVGVFVGVLVAIVIAEGALSDFIKGVGGVGVADTDMVVPVVLMLGSVAGALALLAYLYRTRDRRLRTWVAGIVATVCLVMASFMTPSLQPQQAPALAGPALEIFPMGPDTWARSRQMSMYLRVAPQAQPSDSERLDFQPDKFALQLRDGKQVTVEQQFPVSLVRAAFPPVGQPVKWIIDQSSPDWPSTFLVEPHDFDRTAIANGVKSVTVDGTVTVSRARVVASVPLTTGAAVARGGRRVAIYGVSHDLTGAAVWIQMSVLPRVAEQIEPNPQLNGNDGLQFAIVNDKRGEAMLLEGPGETGGGGSIVLPWIGISTSFTRFTTRASPVAGGALPRDEAWYADAHLVIVEWRVAGWYRTHGSSTVP